jgi:16S rRNA (cytidine1402-2'-O)-methyltransferase
MSGLRLVTTPIGNLGDITLRAEKALREGKNFLCEDTRNTKNLLSLLGISIDGKSFFSFHDHSTQDETEKILSELKKGNEYVLVSDAGSPMISDPAYPLVKRAIEEGIEIDSCPGVSAVLLALELSGLPSSPFTFHGFLGRDKKDRQLFYQKIYLEKATHVFFEGASRVEETLEEISQFFPNEQIAVGRELTKKFQSIYRFSGHEFEKIRNEIVMKGEFVILVNVSSANIRKLNEEMIIEMATDVLNSGNKPKNVAKLISAILNKPTKEVYEILSQTK